MTTTLYTGGERPSHILLPVLPPLKYRSGHLPVMAESALDPPFTTSPPDAVRSYALTRDYSTGDTIATFDLGESLIECRVNEADPGKASLHLTTRAKRTAKDGRVIETRAVGALTSTAQRFNMDMEVSLLENDKVIRSKRWSDEVPRDLL